MAKLMPNVKIPNAFASKLHASILKSGLINPEYIHYNEEDPVVREFLPTGVAALDKALGGGWPVGVMLELFGEEGSGKSTLAYHMCRAFQQAGGYVLAIDTEHSWEEDRFERIGGSKQNVIPLEAETLEQVFELIRLGVKDQANAGDDRVPLLIVVDTVTGVPPEDELTATMAGDSYAEMGKRARIISQKLRSYPRQLGALRTTILFINQVRMKFQQGPHAMGDPYESTGGKAIKFHASTRMKIRRTQKLQGSGDETYGQKILIETIKCKTTSPFQKVELDLIFETGQFNQIAAVERGLKSLKHVKKLKGVYKFSEVLQSQFGFPEELPSDRESEFRTLLEANAEGLSKLVNKLVGKPEETTQTAPATKEQDGNGAEEA
jgi:recombination protein RecA